MLKTIAPENMSVVGMRPFADPAQFGALVARIDGDIEALSRDRRNLAQARRKVAVICAAYVVIALCAQDAIRRDLDQQDVTRKTTPVRRSVIASASAAPTATMRTRVAVVASSNPL